MQVSLKTLLVLIGFFLLSFTAAAIASLFTVQSVRTWYPGLVKPWGTPPAWIFAPVWTSLYALMSLAAWRVWLVANGKFAGATALGLYLVQLFLNAAWSAIFFGARMPGLAFVEIVLLWIAVLATTVAFWRVSPLAGGLMIPYLLWVAYAAHINFGIWRLNRR